MLIAKHTPQINIASEPHIAWSSVFEIAKAIAP